MNNKAIVFDETEFPLVKILFQVKEPSLLQFLEFINEEKRILAYKKPFVLLLDARKLGFLSSELRIAQGNYFKEYQKPLKEYCLCAVILVNSPMVKMMIKGMMIISKPVNPTIISYDEYEAREIATKFLDQKEHGIAKELIM